RVHKPATPCYVHGDRARLAQSVSNLLHNAAKYTDSGGVITVGVTASDEQLKLEVRDTGIGISEYLLPHVFDLFVQSERTLDRAQGGLGIGLSIVKGLVEMHEGTITVASAGAGCGSTFTIRLPRITPPPEVLIQQSRSSAAVKRRVLIVDDNVDAAESLAMLLKSDGHQAETAYGADTALEAVERLRPRSCSSTSDFRRETATKWPDICARAIPFLACDSLRSQVTVRKRIAIALGRRDSTITC